MADIDKIKESYHKQGFVQSEDTIAVEALLTVPFNNNDTEWGPNITSELETSEYVSKCPWSGMPDFALLTVTYEPDELLIEMKSFKFYIASFMNVGITMEGAAKRIMTDLVRCCSPKTIRIEMQFEPRGGYTNTVRSSWEQGDPMPLNDQGE